MSSRLPPTSTKPLDSAEPMRSTPPRASTRSSAMSNRRYLKLVLPRLATRTFIVHLLGEENAQDRFLGTRDHVGADQLAVLRGGGAAGIHRGPDRADVAADERGDVSAADLHL